MIDQRVSEVIEMEPEEPSKIFDLRKVKNSLSRTKYQEEAKKFINEDMLLMTEGTHLWLIWLRLYQYVIFVSKLQCVVLMVHQLIVQNGLDYSFGLNLLKLRQHFIILNVRNFSFKLGVHTLPTHWRPRLNNAFNCLNGTGQFLQHTSSQGRVPSRLTWTETCGLVHHQCRLLRSSAICLIGDEGSKAASSRKNFLFLDIRVALGITLNRGL